LETIPVAYTLQLQEIRQLLIGNHIIITNVILQQTSWSKATPANQQQNNGTTAHMGSIDGKYCSLVQKIFSDSHICTYVLGVLLLQKQATANNQEISTRYGVSSNFKSN